MKTAITAMILTLAMVSCTFGGDSDDEYGKGLLETGTEAPGFTIYPDGTADGITLASLRGKQVMLVFWASWCPDCQEATPGIKELHDTFSSDGLVFVGISFDTDEEDWRTYISDNGLDWIQHREQRPWSESALATAYNIKWIPTLYLIDEAGKVAFATVDISEMKSKLLSLQPVTSSPE